MLVGIDKYLNIITKSITNFITQNHRLSNCENDYVILLKLNDYWEEVLSLKYKKTSQKFKNEISLEIKRSFIDKQIESNFVYNNLTLRSLLNSIVNNLIEYRNKPTNNVSFIIAYKQWCIFMILLKKYKAC